MIVGWKGTAGDSGVCTHLSQKSTILNKNVRKTNQFDMNIKKGIDFELKVPMITTSLFRHLEKQFCWRLLAGAILVKINTLAAQNHLNTAGRT